MIDANFSADGVAKIHMVNESISDALLEIISCVRIRFWEKAASVCTLQSS